jgi:hypothetical protein
LSSSGFPFEGIRNLFPMKLADDVNVPDLEHLGPVEDGASDVVLARRHGCRDDVAAWENPSEGCEWERSRVCARESFKIVSVR